VITVVVTRPVRASAAHAFDVVVRHNVENHPRWEDEVEEIRPLDDVVGVGHRSAMVRRERGRVFEVVNRCVEYVDGRRAAYEHEGSGPMDFWIAFDFEDTGPGASTITATVDMAPRGALRLLTPLFRMGAPRRSARIVDRTVTVIEETPAYAS
jgi:hypothetical protein